MFVHICMKYYVIELMVSQFVSSILIKNDYDLQNKSIEDKSYSVNKNA